MKYNKQGQSEITEELYRKIENYEIYRKSNIAFTVERMFQVRVNGMELYVRQRAWLSTGKKDLLSTCGKRIAVIWLKEAEIIFFAGAHILSLLPLILDIS